MGRGGGVGRARDGEDGAMSIYTPGPWKMHSLGEAVLGRDRIMVADCCICSPRRQTPTCRANAALIASAPDLLEACKNMLWHEDKYAARKQAEAAIAKAEGR